MIHCNIIVPLIFILISNCIISTPNYCKLPLLLHIYVTLVSPYIILLIYTLIFPIMKTFLIIFINFCDLPRHKHILYYILLSFIFYTIVFDTINLDRIVSPSLYCAFKRSVFLLPSSLLYYQFQHNFLC